MKVAELIEILKGLDPELPAAVVDFDGGRAEVAQVRVLEAEFFARDGFAERRPYAALMGSDTDLSAGVDPDGPMNRPLLED